MTIAISEEVTFGGAASIDRAAHLRPRAQEMEGALDARTILLWRGQLLATEDALARLPMDHPALAEPGLGRIFLGLSDGAPLFAQDISGWDPVLPADGSPPVHAAFGAEALTELRAVSTLLSPQDAEVAATARALFCWHETHQFCARCGQPSAPGDGGWLRVCGACGAHHFPRTDPVVIMLITRGDKVLLGRSPQWPERMYSLLAGFVEPGETIEAAVRREVAEEAGVTVGAVDYLCCQPWPFPNSLMFGCAGTALSEEITLDPVELQDARWVSRQEMLSVFAGDHSAIRAPREGAIAGFILRNWLADRLD
nr:NAD(+) diphosphatase [Pseudooceanicola sp. HF7]